MTLTWPSKPESSVWPLSYHFSVAPAAGVALSVALPPHAYTGVVTVGVGTAAPMVRLTLLPSLSQPVCVL